MMRARTLRRRRTAAEAKERFKGGIQRDSKHLIDEA
jgi:hypothetical protein